MNNTQNQKIAQVTDKTLIVGVDIGSRFTSILKRSAWIRPLSCLRTNPVPSRASPKPSATATPIISARPSKGCTAKIPANIAEIVRRFMSAVFRTEKYANNTMLLISRAGGEE